MTATLRTGPVRVGLIGAGMISETPVASEVLGYHLPCRSAAVRRT